MDNVETGVYMCERAATDQQASCLPCLQCTEFKRPPSAWPRVNTRLSYAFVLCGEFKPLSHTGADPGFAKGADRGERGARSSPRTYNGGPGQRDPEAEPLMEDKGAKGAKSPESESFLSIFIQKEGPKVKDLNETI